MFLEDTSAGEVIVALNSDPNRRQSLTLVGDWFSSEAVTSTMSATENRGLREALFTRHPKTVLRHLRDFDEDMKTLLAAEGWSEGNSRERAIGYLREYLAR